MPAEPGRVGQPTASPAARARTGRWRSHPPDGETTCTSDRNEPHGDRCASAIEISGLTKRFFGTLALDDVDLSVGAGEIHALVGENGAASRR